MGCIMRSFIKLNNSNKVRYNLLAGLSGSPILITRPSISGQMFYNSWYNVYEGGLLSAVPARWQLQNTLTLSSGWYDFSSKRYLTTNPLSTTYTVTATDVLSSRWIGWYETAVKNSVKVKTQSQKIAKVVGIPNTPPTTNPTTPPVGVYLPGNTLKKPTRYWYSNSDLGTVSISGVWFKNGVSTGITLSTYSNLSAGDYIQYLESARNISGTTSQYSTAAYILSNIHTVCNTLSSDIYSRISQLSGGATHMDMFSSKDHTTHTYVRNPNFWASDIVDEFTGCAVYKTFSYESYGGVLITPRHVLYCKHAHPWATGTWLPYGPNVVCDLTFVDSNNTTVIATQLHQYRIPTADLCVAVLDKDMESYGMHVAPIAPLHLKYTSYYGLSVWDGYWTDSKTRDEGILSPHYNYNSINNYTDNLFAIGVSQGSSRPTNSVPPTPVSNYPQYHQVMGYVKNILNGYDLKLSAYNYEVWDGDSGTPAFILYDDKVYLYGIVVSSGFGTVPVGKYIDEINAAIYQADLNAISMGRLSETTGYTVSASPIFG